jgi:hypothetical protein
VRTNGIFTLAALFAWISVDGMQKKL